jgi:hypothetical protein
MFFKFNQNDVYVNRIKAHPRVKFFLHSGTIYYNNKPEISITNLPELWAYFDLTAYASASAADAQAVEDQVVHPTNPLSVFTAYQTDLGLGDPKTQYRSIWSISTNVDTNGALVNCQRSSVTSGEGNAFSNGDGGSPDTVNYDFGYQTIDGNVHLIQWFDTAIASSSTIKVKQDDNALATLGTWDRTTRTRYDWYSPAGSVRGPTPTTYSPGGWVYWHISVAANCESIATEITNAYNAGNNQYEKYQAVLQTLIGYGYGSSIILAQAFHPGSTADYGGDVGFVNVQYTREGVLP